MAFYICPPKGTISLQKLAQFAITRLQFLMKVVDCEGDRIKLHDIVMDVETVEGSECLIEGTAKDKISHFILRLACCNNPEMSSFFIKAETVLFDWRFSCMTEDELSRLFKSLDPYLIYNENNTDQTTYESFYNEQTFNEMTDIFQTFVQIKEPYRRWRHVVKKYLMGECEDSFNVPFQNVLNLVRRRNVRLRRGVAAVGYNHLRTVVTDLFKRLVYYGINTSKLVKGQYEDERIIKLIGMLQSMFQRWHLKQTFDCYQAPVSHRDVNDIAIYFPPCMLHALRLLRTRHRLRHHTRLQLTLFLKEVGLPIHEALIFWREEYSKTPHGQGHGCSHNWQHNERRYTYNIRHLYGLEGSRTNYRGHSCQYLQEEFQGHQEEGGCPFSHFDAENIEDILKSSGFWGDSGIIVNEAVNRKSSSACRILLLENIRKENISLKCRSEHFVTQNSGLQSSPRNSEDSIHIHNSSSTDHDMESCSNKQELYEVEHTSTHIDTYKKSEYAEDIKHLTKPIDYYVSYKNFVEGLKNKK